MHNILLAVTGSVAAIKTDKMIKLLKPFGDVKIVATKSGKYFLDSLKTSQEFEGVLEGLSDFDETTIHSDIEEWPSNYLLGDDILHIELRKWADCLVVAPLSANTLAKITHGICDNLVTSVIRAWDWQKLMVLCPAMNTYMWENKPTSQHIQEMTSRGAHVILPISKKLACGDTGIGAMCDIESIVEVLNRKLRWLFPLKRCNGIPINHHPGAFGFHRRKNHHTGVDLYTNDKEPVVAVESGKVVNIEIFTGPKAGHEWWEETWGVMVEGATGVVNYGEVTPYYELKVGDNVERGEFIGTVKRVLFEDKLRTDIPGHSTSMLHLELYKKGTKKFADWHDPQKNPDLLDPTPYLMGAEGYPRTTLTWENSENKAVG